MATTTNFSWTTPDDTDLVKDGASAIRTLGSAVDTSMGDLLGGTSGQLLSKNSNTDMDFAWINPASGGMTLLSTTTLSGASTDISVTGGYVSLYIQIYGITASTTNGYLQIYPNATSGIGYTLVSKRVGTSNGFDNTTQIGVPDLVERTDADNAWVLKIDNYDSATNYKPVNFYGRYLSTGGNAVLMSASGAVISNTAITSLRFQNAAGGNWAGGTVKVYGVS